jgi:Zn-dependent peptidase ImmA (M78 family)
MCIRETKLEWTNEKKTSFSKDYPTMPTARLIKKYHVSEKAINVMASKLKLKKENYWWSPEDCQRLKENYNATGTGMQELLEMFPGKTKWAIINKYRELTNKR